jgi:hypothetical protein
MLKPIGGALALLLLSTPLAAGLDEKAVCRCKPRKVGDSGSRKDWDGYRKGIVWHYSVEEAMKIARAENKMVFWYHVVGDLDKEGC